MLKKNYTLKVKLIFCVGFSLLLNTAFVSAAIVVEQGDSLRQRDLKEVEVNGRKKSGLIYIAPVQVKSQSEIDKMNAQNLSDIVKHFAGVTIKDYGGVGGLKTVSVRGLGPAHTGVVYDGVMMSDIQTGQIDVSQFLVENIQNVSLFNGQPLDMLQSARIYSSASVLSFQSRIPDYNAAHTLNGTVSMKAGSFKMYNPSFNLYKNFSEKLALNLSANYLNADGTYKFMSNINPQGSNEVEKERVNSDVQSLRSEMNVVYHFKPQEVISLKMNQYYSDRGIPGPDTYYISYSTDRLKDENYFSQFQYENKTKADIQYMFLGKWTNQNSEYSEVSPNYTSFADHKRVDSYHQNEYYLSSSILYRPIASLTFSGSADWWYNNLFSHSNMSYVDDAKPVRNTVLGNIAVKYLNERFSVGSNLLFTANFESVDSGQTSAQDRRKFSPSVFGSYKILADKDLVLRAFYKDIFRLPTFTDLYYHDFGYKALKPENTEQYDLGLTYNEYHGDFIDELQVSVDAYYNKITDKITVVYGMPYSTVRNIGIVEIKGCDFTLLASKKLNKNAALTLNMSYTYQLAQNFDNNPDTYGDIIPYTPVHSGSASLNYDYKKWSTGCNVVFAGKRYSGQNANPSNILDPYADLGWFLKSTFGKINVTGEVLNLLNQNYDIVQFYPMPGRNYRISIQYKF